MRSLLFCAALSGCSSVSYDTMVGIWAAEDDEGNQRAMEFVEGGAYELYKYPMGTEPILVQSGTAELLDDHVVTGYDDPQDDVLVFTVEWAEPAAGIAPGTAFGNRVLHLSKSELEIEIDVATETSRVYEAVEEIP